MKRSVIIISVGTFLAAFAFAQDSYIVKIGDTLSHIVKIKFPKKEVYGANGTLRKVIFENPQIKNPNRIYAKQIVYFLDTKPTLSTTPLAKVEVAPEETIIPLMPIAVVSNSSSVNRRVSFLPGFDDWNISVLYGAKYLSVSQNGALGDANIGALFLNKLRLNSEFIFENWSTWFQLDSYKFKYESLNASNEKSMFALDLGLSYKSFFGSFGVDQNPLFRNNNGVIQMTKMSEMYLAVGAKKDVEIPSIKPTFLKMKAWVRYPLSISTDNTQVKASSASGFGVHGQIGLNRQIFSKEDYSLQATWMTDLGYQKISQTVKWDTSNGEVDSKLVDASTAIGLLFKF